jgi:heat shock protein HslJ
MRSLLFIALCIVVVACSVQKNSAVLAQIPVEGAWTLQTLNGSTISTLKRPITISFSEADKRVTGYAGCNQYFSSYTLNGSSIRFTAPGRTKMYCNETMDLEEKFILTLADVEVIKSEPNKLIFLKGETVLLEFAK